MVTHVHSNLYKSTAKLLQLVYHLHVVNGDIEYIMCTIFYSAIAPRKLNMCIVGTRHNGTHCDICEAECVFAIECDASGTWRQYHKLLFVPQPA